MTRKKDSGIAGASWPELVQADRDRNVGMPIELISAEAYAEQDGISVETYIIALLRAERDRRQELERLVADHFLSDMIIDEARAAGMSVLDYVANRLGNGRGTRDISKDFTEKILRRVEERFVR